MRFFDSSEQNAVTDIQHADLSDLATLFSGVIDRLPDGLIILDVHQRVMAINGLARTFLGLGQMTCENLADLSDKAEADFTMAEKICLRGAASDFIATAADRRAVLVSVRFVRDRASGEQAAVFTMRDLQMLDRLRKLAAGDRPTNRFKFTNDTEASPDFGTQRRISPAIDTAIKHGERALAVGARVLLTGESGTGKTELAKYLHRKIGNPEDPFVHVNCGSIPEQLFESEMFGHTKGSFTGASSTGRRGLLEDADGGTLFLDEIGEMPALLQAKLLKFLDDGYVQQIGARKGKKVACRVIAATNRDLQGLVRDGAFRGDLFYRLASVPLALPALRDQPPLIDHLIDHMLRRINESRETALSVNAECRTALLRYVYPGNCRELQNILLQLSLIDGAVATRNDLPSFVVDGAGALRLIEPDAADSDDYDMKSMVKAYERDLIDEAIRIHGSKRKAATALGVDIGTIVRKTRAEDLK
ncbi:MAG: sigma 54-interacting transcriptional regulator [Alphaproteobacteria bacterium]